MKTTFLYELIDPITDETRYIGKANNPQIRFARHLKDKHLSYKCSWIKSLKERSLEPILNIIDEVNESEWQFWERFYIQLYKSWNCRLTNLQNGGEGCSNLTEETRKKMSENHGGGPKKGHFVSKETRSRISQSNKGRIAWNKGVKGVVKMSEESRNKVSETLKGHLTSQETRDKISQSKKGKKHSEESKKKMSLAQTGKRRSEETKREMSLARKGKPNIKNKGRKHSLETKIKISLKNKGQIAWNKGKKLSTEHKKKISLTLTRKV